MDQNASGSGLIVATAAIGAVAWALKEWYVRYSLSGAVVWRSAVTATEKGEKPADDDLETLVQSLKNRKILNYSTRVEALKGLLAFVECESEAIVEALAEDLGRPRFESLVYDVYSVRSEIVHVLNSLNTLTAWKRVPMDTSLLTFPSSGAYLCPEPYGVALIVAPFNFPFMLSLIPVLGALAGGNAVVLKPSPQAVKSAHLLAKLEEYVSTDCLRVVGARFATGDPSDSEREIEFSTRLLKVKFDKIFFTGSPKVGRIVASAAALHLTPCVLELGGKNPVYVHRDADVDVAARRIVWGRMLNAGQQCIAPDYVMCHESLVDILAKACSRRIEECFGKDPQSSQDFGRIVNGENVKRLQRILQVGEKSGSMTVVCGGGSDVDRKYFAPTVVTFSRIDEETPLIDEEIFGPILVIVPIASPESAIEYIVSKPKPLSLYVFTASTKLAKEFVTRTSAGGVTINDTIFHGAHPHLPFGGVGNSGYGGYHGDDTFHSFVHYKPILHKNLNGLLQFANFFVYPPWTPLKYTLISLIMHPFSLLSNTNTFKSSS